MSNNYDPKQALKATDQASVAGQHTDHDDHDHDHDHDHDDHDHAPGATHVHPENAKTDHDDHDDADHDHDDHDDYDHKHGDDDHDHDDDDHDHDDHDHDHESQNIISRLLGSVVHSHTHNEEGGIGRYLEESERGIWALKISLLGLAFTAGFQVVIAIISSSAGLLADTVHNFSDALTAIPLWVAFVVGRRAANQRYTYGYGRAEDLAGLFVILMVALSAGIAFYESLRKLIAPEPVQNIGWVIAAAIVGFIGNEAVAWFRIKVGQDIGSAALVADGQHARIDGLTSLAVLFGAFGVMLGFPQADPIVGILIGVAILFILKDTVVVMYRRMMDAVEPELIEKLEKVATGTDGVLKVHSVRGRWVGHKLLAELSIEVDGNLSTSDSHKIGEEVRHRLWHKVPRLADVSVHVDPLDAGEATNGEITHHDTTAHHQDATLNRRSL